MDRMEAGRRTGRAPGGARVSEGGAGRRGPGEGPRARAGAALAAVFSVEAAVAVLAAAALTLGAAATPAPAHEGKHDAAKAPAAKQTLTGELIDTRCYLEHGGKGADHAQCASLCAKDGIPAGLLTAEGKVYVLIVPPSALANVMAMQAEVTGAVHGEAIIPDSVKVKKGEAWKDVAIPKHM